MRNLKTLLLERRLKDRTHLCNNWILAVFSCLLNIPLWNEKMYALRFHPYFQYKPGLLSVSLLVKTLVILKTCSQWQGKANHAVRMTTKLFYFQQREGETSFSRLINYGRLKKPSVWMSCFVYVLSWKIIYYLYLGTVRSSYVLLRFKNSSPSWRGRNSNKLLNPLTPKVINL